METTTSSSDSVDEFFGDQSSEPDTSDLNHAYSETSNGAAAHEYRSRESSIKTLSYLDGFDETKEEKMQDGFCDGYKQSFGDSFLIGQQLGCLSSRVVLDESPIIKSHSACDSTTRSNDGTAKKNLQNNANLVHDFLTNKILIGAEDMDDYALALEKLTLQLKKCST
eukprot:scaffold19360_cov59-Cyclotella_meneghiniana.AAC.3